MPVLVTSDQSSIPSASDALAKLVEIVVRSRLGNEHHCEQRHAPSETCCFALNYTGGSFSLVINTLQKNGCLLERWVLTLDTSSAGQEGSRDMILLLQAAYSYTRQMPVHTKLANNSFAKTDLAITMRLSSGISCFSHSPSPVEFSHDANLQTHQFRPVLLSYVGLVTLEVVYAADRRNSLSHELPVTPQQHHVSMRRLSRLSLSAIDQTLESLPLPVPIPTPHMQYTHRSVAYSTSPSPSFFRGNTAAITPTIISTTATNTPAANHNNSSFCHRRSSIVSVESLVGSYEECLLSGRMSTVPSKPIVFQAQIGVLGHGNCTPRCPPHKTVMFPAFFYELQNDALPVPYVGTIELTKRYRLPARGQLQIVIKNPNKTAVKLFLIPYDVREMPPGSKTFLRQKSYAAGSLRYAIHLHMCRTEKNRVYLFKSFRVVFANRISDSRETLKVSCDGPLEYSILTPTDREFLS
ncbi:hypothetical protein BX666DRAFT_1949622 [Dichotomocladium elegans]|nr:hypothetical protein BX666DRAFT_1949622 [Dichotomocladium elegans]